MYETSAYVWHINLLIFSVIYFEGVNSQEVPLPKDTGIANYMKKVFCEYEKIRGINIHYTSNILFREFGSRIDK